MLWIELKNDGQYDGRQNDGKKKWWPVLNIDLWDRLLNAIENHSVKFFWVKWHNWHVENERCDELVWKARKWVLLDDFDKSLEVKNLANWIGNTLF